MTSSCWRWCTAFGLTLWLAAPGAALGAPQDDEASCGKRISEAVRSYAQQVFGALANCANKNLSHSDQIDCVSDSQTSHAIQSASDKLESAVGKCTSAGLTLLCPLEATTPDDLFAKLTSAPGSVAAQVNALEQAIFVSSTAGCPRPTPPVSKPAYDCARALGGNVPRVVNALQQCLSKCEVALTQHGGEACVDADTGEPIKDKVIDCVTKATQRLTNAVTHTCSAASLVELGCPLGAASADDLDAAAGPMLDALAQGSNQGIFHSSCRTYIPISTVPTTAQVHLTPSGTQRTINCGDVLDATFFGSDTGLVLDTTLDCQAVATGVNGIVIAASGVQVDLARLTVSGPANSSLRTGTGVLVAAGAHDVTIERAKVIQRFGTGVADSGDNDGLFLSQLVIQGNRADGIVLHGTALKGDSNSVKKNGGNGIVVLGNGNTVSANTLEENQQAGILVSGTDNTVEGNQAGSLGEHGNSTYGILVTTSGNLLDSNTAEANALAGLEVRAPSTLQSNSATGNLGIGFEITTAGSSLESNRADQNVGFEFVIAPSNIDRQGNRANGVAFRFGSAGGNFE